MQPHGVTGVQMDRRQAWWVLGGGVALVLSLGAAPVLALILYVVLFAVAFVVVHCEAYDSHRRRDLFGTSLIKLC